jgi:hypothetical protein
MTTVPKKRVMVPVPGMYLTDGVVLVECVLKQRNGWQVANVVTDAREVISLAHLANWREVTPSAA